MRAATVTNSTQFITRQKELLAQEASAAREAETAHKNRKFTQVYVPGWNRLTELVETNPGASRLYIFFAKHIDVHCGAVICDQRFIANHLNVNQSTIARWLVYLQKVGAIVRIPVVGKVCAYALNPNEVWKGYNTSKDYAAFNAKVLTLKNEKVKQRLIDVFKQVECHKGPIIGEVPEQM